MTFRVGQQVVCIINGTFMHPENPGSVDIKKGEVFTIRGLDEPRHEGERVALWFEEISLPAMPGFREPSFAARRFRPLVRTDISVFTRMLEKAPKREEANV